MLYDFLKGPRPELPELKVLASALGSSYMEVAVRRLLHLRSLHDLCNAGLSQKRASRQLDIPATTLVRWIAAYQRGGLRGLSPGKWSRSVRS